MVVYNSILITYILIISNGSYIETIYSFAVLVTSFMKNSGALQVTICSCPRTHIRSHLHLNYPHSHPCRQPPSCFFEAVIAVGGDAESLGNTRQSQTC
jgi:hypothetical protein